MGSHHMAGLRLQSRNALHFILLLAFIRLLMSQQRFQDAPALKKAYKEGCITEDEQANLINKGFDTNLFFSEEWRVVMCRPRYKNELLDNPAYHGTRWNLKRMQRGILSLYSHADKEEAQEYQTALRKHLTDIFSPYNEEQKQFLFHEASIPALEYVKAQAEESSIQQAKKYEINRNQCYRNVLTSSAYRNNLQSNSLIEKEVVHALNNAFVFIPAEAHRIGSPKKFLKNFLQMLSEPWVYKCIQQGLFTWEDVQREPGAFADPQGVKAVAKKQQVWTQLVGNYRSIDQYAVVRSEHAYLKKRFEGQSDTVADVLAVPSCPTKKVAPKSQYTLFKADKNRKRDLRKKTALLELKLRYDLTEDALERLEHGMSLELLTSILKSNISKDTLNNYYYLQYDKINRLEEYYEISFSKNEKRFLFRNRTLEQLNEAYEEQWSKERLFSDTCDVLYALSF